jgi:seryl-tRNA synthetase
MGRLNEVGNIVDESVLADTNEDNNIVVRTWGDVNDIKIDGTLGHMNHHHLMRCLGMYDPERGSKIAGHRGYFFKNSGVFLNQALINYSIDFLFERGFTVLQPPFFMKKEYMEKTCELGDYEANLYDVERGEAYLIATSEQPISAMHADEWLKTKDLPLQYCGISP